MTGSCPHCGQPLPAPVDPVAERVDQLRRWCADTGHWVSPDGRVREETLAAILGVCVEHVRNLRYGSRLIPYHRTGGGRGRITYSLQTIAEHIERSSECI